MSRYTFNMAEIEDNLRLVENTPPTRLTAHRQAGFAPVYAVIDDILSQAVETPTRYTPADQIGNLYGIVRSNLTRLFQLAVFFDDHFPRGKDEKPSAHLLKILNKEWGVTIPGLEDEHIWEILDYWYQRHLVWWKANRQSKRWFEDEDDLLLVSLLDQYRRSRRSGMSRRDREDDTATRDDNWEGRMALRYGPALSLTPPDSQVVQESEWLAHETRLFVSTYLAWKRADFNHPELVDSIVLPCHPSDLEDFIRNAHLQVARNLVMMLANMKELSDDEELATIAGLQTECVWITLDDGPDINESYRALPEPDTDSEDDGTGFRTGAPYRTLPPQFARWLPKGVAERQKELAALEEQNQTEEEDTEDDADGEQSEEQTEEDDDNDDNDNEDNEEEEGGDEDADGDEDEDDDSDEYNDNDEDEDFGDDDDDDFDGGDEGGVARNQVENINPDAYKKMYVGVKETRSGLKLYRI